MNETRWIGSVEGCQLVETSRDGPELLEPVEVAFDHVAPLVELAIEVRGLPPAVPRHVRFCLVGTFGDD